MACSKKVVMAQKIIASQFTYASRSIATPERHCRARARFRQGDRPSLDCGPPRTYRGADDRPFCQPPAAFALKLRQKVDALAVALMKRRISGRAVAKPQG